MPSEPRADRRILLAFPHGFCAGVQRAVETIHAALQRFPPPIYCYNEIVHNRIVVDDLARRGVVFVDEVDPVPPGSVLLLSAHGVAPEVRRQAEERRLLVIDATCPFVGKVHTEVRRYAGEGHTVVLIGKRGHDEVVGVAGEAPEHVVVIESVGDAERLEVPDPERIAAVTQTTLSVEETETVLAVLRRRFPRLVTPLKSDVCYATTNRQFAVREIARRAGFVLVLGARNSSNSNRLVEVAEHVGARAFLVPDLAALAAVPVRETDTVGVTAGASTPESFVGEALAALRAQGFGTIEPVTVAEEDLTFALPPQVR